MNRPILFALLSGLALGAVLMAQASHAADAPKPAAPHENHVTLSDPDMAFLAAFITHYAGQGCDIHTQTGVEACQAAPQALAVWQRLQASAGTEPRK